MGLSSTALGLRALALASESPSGGRLEHLAKHGKSYDVVVVGPSFVQMHFIPPAFDARMAELGHPVRSIGFGLSGLRGGELDYYLQRILALRLPKLKHVLCDVTLDQLRPLERANVFKRRVIYWHDPAQLSFMQRVIEKLTDDPGRRSGYLWRHAQHALLKLGNVGEGVEGLRQGVLLGDRYEPPKHRFHVTERAGKKQLKLAAKFLKKNGKGFARKAKKLAARKSRKLRPLDNEIADRYRDRIRAAGLDATFVVSPITKHASIATKVRGDEPLQVLDFNDPGRYPELYDPALHYDTSHFHYQGAVLFSQKLAEAFAAQLDAQAGKGRR